MTVVIDTPTNDMSELVTEEVISNEGDVADIETVETHEVELPKKFQGKTVEDVVKSYTELEKELGRKANEVGELRRLTDEYLRRELSKTNTPTQENDSEDDDIFSTKATVRKELDSNPKIKALEEKLAQQEREKAISQFATKHPDYSDIGADSNFQEWVKASHYRQKMFAKADAMDLEAADDLLTMWKETQKIRSNSEASEQAKEKRKADLKKVSGESSSTGEGKRKVYNRVELMRLRMNDPDKYNAMQDEIVTAYREGRVK